MLSEKRATSLSSLALEERSVRRGFTLPALLVVLLIVAFPIAYNIFMSFHTWFVASGKDPEFAGLKNYVRFLSDDRFWNSMRVTAVFTVSALSIQTILGTGLALFLNRNFTGKNLVKLIFLFPIAATPVAVSLIWGMMYNYDLGIFNYLLESIGLKPLLWLASPRSVLMALVITDTWQWTPLILLIVLASLESLPTDPFESARVDGAGMLQVIWHITLPLVRPAIVVAVMIRSIDAIKTFDLIYVMTQGGPDIASENLNLFVFQTGFSYFRMGAASTLAIILFSLVLGVNILLALVRNAGERQLNGDN